MALAQFLFDHEWYQKTYDFKGTREQAWIDFCNQDKWERWPNHFFDSLYYLSNAPDVASAGVNPFIHYCVYGWKENRLVHPDQPGYNLGSPQQNDWWDFFFWPDWYIEQQAALAWPVELQNDTLTHFLKLGYMGYFEPNPLFSPKFYFEQYAGLSELVHCASTHYLSHGWLDKRSHHWLFDCKYQEGLYSDPNIPLLIQYAGFGAWQVRHPGGRRPVAVTTVMGGRLALGQCDGLFEWIYLGYRRWIRLYSI